MLKKNIEEIIKYLIEQCHANVEEKDNEGKTPLDILRSRLLRLFCHSLAKISLLLLTNLNDLKYIHTNQLQLSFININHI